MFSSFKEKLNTSLSTLQEKGLSTTLSTTHATNPGPGPGHDTAGTGTGTAGQTVTHAAVDIEGIPVTEAPPGSGAGHSVIVPVKTTDLTSLASHHSPTPTVPHHQHQLQQQPSLQQPQGSFGSIASRISSGASSSSLFFRRPLQATRSSADLITVGTTTTSSSSLTHTSTTGTHHFPDVVSGTSGPNRLAILVQKLTLNPQEEKADPAEIDKIRDFYNQQQEQQPSGTELSTVVIEKLEILRRYEARFPDLADAFKKIVQEKVAAEAILKASTPLEDLGDVDALEAHLQNMSSKNEMSMQEIKRLSEELRQTLKAKEEESTSQAAVIETLRTQLMEFEWSAKSKTFTEIDLDIDTKVNTSLDLSGSPPSAPNTPPPQTDGLPSTAPTTPIASNTPPTSKSKKPKDPEKKNQALRELMIRLEAVLKEKNQAQEDQEEAIEQVRQLQTRLDQEIQVNKDITTELDQLRVTVAELELNRSGLEASKDSAESGSTLALEDTILAVRSEAAAAQAAKKELETKLATVQKAHTILQESTSQTERTLETAKNQIREMGDVSKQLRTVKMEMDDIQEELQEKQRLLDLERQWREEAETSRDAVKREYDAAVKCSRQLLEEAQERSNAMASKVDAVLATTGGYSERIGELQSTILQMEERFVGVNRVRVELERALADRSDRVSDVLVLNDRIVQLEQESQDRLLQIRALTFEKESRNIALADIEATTSAIKPDVGATIAVRIGQVPVVEPSATTVQTLQDKISQLEAELDAMSQVPSLNDLKKLHEELNAAKQTISEAEETIAVLQAKVQAAAATSEAAKESDATISLEELSSLKQERAELSEKLARLERLHQGFERSSSERIQTLEQELAVLLEQKAALEAQVQEQSDLLIREKEKEKELEQARVAEGIDRVTLELAAVRTAERFASSKVTELAKERDLVAEKVVKLEKHLETLRECKVGQEQSLTGRIQELTLEKETLEKHVETLQLELEHIKAQSEASDKEWIHEQTRVSDERDRAIARVTELESDLLIKADESDAAQLARQEQIKDKEQLASLTLELKTKSKKLAIAQEQAQVQRTMQADKIAQLSDQIQALKTERDSLSQLKIELELQFGEMRYKVERLEQQVKVMEEDAQRILLAKTEAQEQKQLKKVEIDLEKTAQKLAKVDQAKKSLEEEYATLKSTLSKNQQEAKTQANLAASQQSSTLKELGRLKATQVKTLQERDQFQKEREQLEQANEAIQKELERNLAELETLKRMHDSAETQMREYQSQLTEARNRVDTLEELTSIAKRVAETKVTELEQLKVKSAESEKEFARIKNQLRTKDEEARAQKDKFRSEVEETRQVLGNEIAELTEQLQKSSLDSMALKELNVQQSEELDVTRSRLEAKETLVDTLEQEVEESKRWKRDLELELQHFKDLEEIMARDRAEHLAIVEDYKMREGHLRTVNKTLKEEVRKLQKLGLGSPLPSPTSPHVPYYSQSDISSTPTPATPRPKASGGGGPQPLGRAATMALPVTPRWSSSGQSQPAADDDVNVEYLKNVLLNFMEHKERRQQLIPVVAQMLRLSLEETKRFSKVA
ncbi:hypothetical protein BGZ97_011547 [Linnemannia gamsii]|uniref:GRIP domain-containing protein n=1 Tax=Linnemannia gamsii TaxID=64522 RepID=A0A9P6UMQ6_9FUNG|nr:hypothetical protein BGZ97_011547 [Linnemannia gamsii]